MTSHNTLFLVTVLAALTAVPALAAADHDDDYRRRNVRTTFLGEVGTHRHDAEDYLTVSTTQRFERIELRAEGNPVRLDGVDIQFVDGRKYRVELRETLRPGQRVLVDVPAYSPIKMLVLDYDNPGRHWRAREDARVSVRGYGADFRDRGDRFDQRSIRDRRTTPYRERDRYQDPRFQVRGGIYIRVGT